MGSLENIRWWSLAQRQCGQNSMFSKVRPSPPSQPSLPGSWKREPESEVTINLGHTWVLPGVRVKHMWGLQRLGEISGRRMAGGFLRLDFCPSIHSLSPPLSASSWVPSPGQRTRWWDGITDWGSTDMSSSKLREMAKDRKPGVLQPWGLQRVRHNQSELNWPCKGQTEETIGSAECRESDVQVGVLVNSKKSQGLWAVRQAPAGMVWRASAEMAVGELYLSPAAVLRVGRRGEGISGPSTSGTSV